MIGGNRYGPKNRKLFVPKAHSSSKSEILQHYSVTGPKGGFGAQAIDYAQELRDLIDGSDHSTNVTNDITERPTTTFDAYD
jgi:hypothetical protein